MNEPKLKWTDCQLRYSYENFSVAKTFFGECQVIHKHVGGEEYWVWSSH